MRLKAKLLLVADAYGEAMSLSDGRVSTLVYGSGDRLRRLREGKDMLSANIEDGLQWFSDRWPEGAVWPSEVLRPAPRPPAPVSSSAAPAGPPT